MNSNSAVNNTISTSLCWCGSKKIVPFSEHYFKCEDCHCLIVKKRKEDCHFSAGDLSDQLYRKDYWTQPEDENGQQRVDIRNIYQRSRDDLSERCLYWLSNILKYKLPPAKSLEIGCGHGGFVSLMKFAGFDAAGTEMSPWVVEYAKNSFNAQVFLGRIEELGLSKKSFDCLILFDVLEHLTDPKTTLQRCAELLKDDGILVIQTPCFRKPDLSYDELVSRKDVFLEMMREWEHLTLFSEKGLKHLLASVGLTSFAIEPHLFPYDMFVVAGKSSPRINSEDEISDTLQKTSYGRFAQAFLDLYKKCKESEKERDARLAVIQDLTNHWSYKTLNFIRSLKNRIQ